MPTQHPDFDTALPAYAAFKPEDLEEARNRWPSSDLSGYAQARGLEYLTSLNPAGYWGVVPGDERLQFNVVRGPLPGGGHGIVFHHAREVPLSRNAQWTDWDAHIGVDLHGMKYDADPDQRRRYYDGDKPPLAAGVPTTVAATLVPQVATLPGFQFVNHDNKRRNLVLSDDRIELERYGLPGLWAEPLEGGPPPDAGLVEALMTTQFAHVLAAFAQRPYMQLRIDHAQLALGIDGYEYDADVLDSLMGAAAAAAAAVADVARPLHHPQPFGAPLPDAHWPRRHSREEMERSPSLFPPQEYVPGMLKGAKKRDWVPEDSAAYHRAFPDLPVPGTAFAVMRFEPRGFGGAIGRVAWHAERHMYRYNIGRNAVLLPAPAGAAPTPPGGVRVSEMNLNYAVADGIFSVWQGRNQDPLYTMVGMEDLVKQALELAPRAGVR